MYGEEEKLMCALKALPNGDIPNDIKKIESLPLKEYIRDERFANTLNKFLKNRSQKYLTIT